MTLILVIALSFGWLWAQDITGDWHGLLEVSGIKLRIVVHIKGSGGKLEATFDSPDQGAFGLPVSSVTFKNRALNLEIDAPPITYSGTWKDGTIQGVFRQSGLELPLDLQRDKLQKPVYDRPQEPKKPFPYKVKQVKFRNREAGIKLAGTLTLPAGKGAHPAVILISGSGPQDRNEELMGHKPFLVIADHLTRQGFAVLRFDDRGTGKSGGQFSTATSFDFASDVKSAVSFLKKRKDISQIGLVGHSEGGLIAPLVATETPEVQFIVLLAGPGQRGDQLLLLQEELIWRVDETDEEKIQRSLYINRYIFDLVLRENDTDALQAQMRDFLTKSVADSLIDIPEGYSQEDVTQQYMDQMTNPWMLTFLRHDPAPVLEEVRCPVLALNGSKDLQVPAKVNLEAISAALEKGGNRNCETIELEGLNHLFQECETGHPNEYAAIEQTFSPRALEALSDWLKKQTGLK